MADETGISWADSTFNPWVGCSKVSPGCAHCYAETLVTGRMGRANTWGEDGVRQRTSSGLWAKPVAWEKHHERFEAENGHRRRVFCASLADVFEPRPELDPWRFQLFDLIERTPSLDWLLLTKRPDVARDWLGSFYGDLALPGDYAQPIEPFPNVWVGTSIENSRFTYRADQLREVPAAVRFLSCEPLLGSLFQHSRPLDESDPAGQTVAEDAGERGTDTRGRAPLDLTAIDWVIVGGESGGRNARPMHPDWVREIRDAVLERNMAGYPCSGCNGLRSALCGDCEASAREQGRPALHFKQWGSWTPSYGSPSDELVAPDGRIVTHREDAPDGSQFMRYAGASPGSGGKLLDGVDWCEIPGSPVLTPA